MKVFRYRVYGRVQGVGFRYFTLRSARLIGLTGWVRNMLDGSVEAHACGSKTQHQLFENELRKGPSFSTVDRVQRLELESTEKSPEYHQFDIIH